MRSVGVAPGLPVNHSRPMLISLAKLSPGGGVGLRRSIVADTLNQNRRTGGVPVLLGPKWWIDLLISAVMRLNSLFQSGR